MVLDYKALSNVIGNEEFSLAEKKEALDSMIEREFDQRKEYMKKKAFDLINETIDFDKRDARIIVTSLLLFSWLLLPFRKLSPDQ